MLGAFIVFRQAQTRMTGWLILGRKSGEEAVHGLTPTVACDVTEFSKNREEGETTIAPRLASPQVNREWPHPRPGRLSPPSLWVLV